MLRVVRVDVSMKNELKVLRLGLFLRLFLGVSMKNELKAYPLSCGVVLRSLSVSMKNELKEGTPDKPIMIEFDVSMKNELKGVQEYVGACVLGNSGINEE